MNEVPNTCTTMPTARPAHHRMRRLLIPIVAAGACALAATPAAAQPSDEGDGAQVARSDVAVTGAVVDETVGLLIVTGSSLENACTRVPADPSGRRQEIQLPNGLSKSTLQDNDTPIYLYRTGIVSDLCTRVLAGELPPVANGTGHVEVKTDLFSDGTGRQQQATVAGQLQNAAGAKCHVIVLFQVERSAPGEPRETVKSSIRTDC